MNVEDYIVPDRTILYPAHTLLNGRAFRFAWVRDNTSSHWMTGVWHVVTEHIIPWLNNPKKHRREYRLKVLARCRVSDEWPVSKVHATKLKSCHLAVRRAKQLGGFTPVDS